ncbi:MAG: hypothetical protein QOC78_1485 [Solirubrobacteraceae bacterium]|jgi:hypothetical protein|nr:hypothetical protein [Solirubrobacteraceae bacterium]MEA2394007.1 hypothetical protein [Solirubrobacteraceae bacterium]
MPNVVVLRKRGPRADEILDAFEERTRLAARDGDEARIFTLAGAGHEVDVEGQLDAVDPAWAEHVELVTEL